MFNAERSIEDYLERLNLAGFSETEKLVRVTQAIADIPWGEGRTIQEVFEKGVGTCTGKHKVLAACFDRLNIKYKPVVATFRWADQLIDYPQNIQKLLDEGAWDHGHNFLQLENGIDVDVIFNKELEPFGFKSFPENWDGSSSFVGFDNFIKRWDGVDIDQLKSTLITELSEKQRNQRERFLTAFVSWVEEINKKPVSLL